MTTQISPQTDSDAAPTAEESAGSFEPVNLPQHPAAAPRTFEERREALLHQNMVAQLDAAFRRNHFLASTSGIGKLLDQNCRKSNRGLKRKGLDGTLYYTLMLTSVARGLGATVNSMHRVAATLPYETRKEYGIVRYRLASVEQLNEELAVTSPKVVVDYELNVKHLYHMTEKLRENLDFTHPELSDAERSRRKSVVDDIVQRALAASHIIDTGHGTYAIDDTGIWAWSRGRKRTGKLENGPDRPIRDEDLHPSTEAPAAAAPDNSITNRAKNCPDARWSNKSSPSGDIEFYGYKAHTIVNTDDPSRDQHIPSLIHALELTPANQDIVDVSLRLIDQIQKRSPFTTLIGDRHYGFKRFDRWAMQLWERGINQVLDLRVDKPKAFDYYGTSMIDGTPHCPRVPKHLTDLHRPGLNEDKSEFWEQIEEREQFAFRIVSSPLAKDGNQPRKAGKPRFECPARSGKVACPLVPNKYAEALDEGRPIIHEPPKDNRIPCKNRTFTADTSDALKHLQASYWGGKTWEKSYALRSSVERVFGNFKNKNCEDVRRGFCQLTGLPLVTLAVTAAAVSYNIRTIEKHLRETGVREIHPLLNHPRANQILETSIRTEEEIRTELLQEQHEERLDIHTPVAA